jgi:DNA-binding CsgD family transcriptional regulator
MYWDKLLKEVLLSRELGSKSFSFIGIDQDEHRYASIKRTMKIPRSPSKVYWLGPKYEGVYFSRREAECMVQLLKGKTVHKVAEAVHLSPRTIEYYLKNMKAKIGCRTKFELVEMVSDSDFLQNIDFS